MSPTHLGSSLLYGLNNCLGLAVDFNIHSVFSNILPSVVRSMVSELGLWKVFAPIDRRDRNARPIYPI